MPAMTKQLSTIEEVISELGGVDAVKELTNRASSSAVPMWKNRKRFPTTTYKVMKSALQQRGVDALDKLWGMP
jgi:hypothetical protein